MSEQANEQAEVIYRQIEKALDRVSIKTAFGKPIQQGEVTVIPVARVTVGFGYGYGTGGPATTPPEDADDEADEPAAAGQPGAAGGVGGGGGGGATPLGYIQFDAHGAHFEPIMDISRMGLAGIAMVAWSVFWIAAAARSRAKKARGR